MLIDFKVEGPIAYLALNRPEALNALNHALQDALEAALDRLAADLSLRVVILTGRGRAFCAGSDVKDLAGVSPALVDRIMRREARLCQRFTELLQVTIAAIDGYALGGGAALALYQDLRVAAETAVLGFPEVKLGWNPPYGMSLLARTVGKGRAKELLMTGRMIDAYEALRIGLVDRVVPPGGLVAEAERLAREIAAHPPLAVRAIKEVLDHEGGMPLRAADDYETRAFGMCFATEEAQRGIKDFIERGRG